MSDQSLALRGALSTQSPHVQSPKPDAIEEVVLAHTRPDGSLNTRRLAAQVAQGVEPEKLSGMVEAYLAEQGYSLFEIAHFSREVQHSITSCEATVDQVRPGLYKVTHSNGEIEFTDIPPRLSRQQETESETERTRYEAGKQRDEARRLDPVLRKPMSVERAVLGHDTSSDWFGAKEAHELLMVFYGGSINIPDAESLNPQTIAVAKQIFQDILTQSQTLHELADSFVAETIPTPEISTSELVNLVYGESPIAPDLQPLVHSMRVFLQYQLGGGRESITEFLNSSGSLFEPVVQLKRNSQLIESIILE